MNREKILFAVVLVLTVLWGGMSLTSPYERQSVPNGRPLSVDVGGGVESYASLPEGGRLTTLLSGVPALDSILENSRVGRTALVAHSDLLPVQPATLPAPLAQPTPWIGLPVAPFPPVSHYARLREDFIPPIEGERPEPEGEPGGLDDPEPGATGAVDDLDDDLPSVSDLLGANIVKKEFVPEEWDQLVMGPGVKRFGRISLTDSSKKAGHTKYDLLLEENRELEFAFEQVNIDTLRIQVSTPKITLESSDVKQVVFADTVENRYWTRRTTDRVRVKDQIALCDLADWVLELAEEGKYDRMAGLKLAVDTYAEALVAREDYLRAVLGQGEALHRRFEFDKELALYETVKGESEVPEVLIRQARIATKLGLDEAAAEYLDRAIFRLPGDFRAWMLRGEARYRLRRYEEALADFAEAEKVAGTDEKPAALEASGRALISLGRPAEAASRLSAAEDVPGLLTLGAALYSQMKWVEAQEAFQKAADLEPENARALTNLGLARARTAPDWEGVELALEMLAKARGMDPLNYFMPPLGQGFAEQRRALPGDDQATEYLTRSVTHYQTAVEALPADPYARYILARSYLRDGLYDQARKEFRNALILDFRFSDALLGAGTANLRLGEWKNARALLERFSTVERRAYEQETDAKAKEVARRGTLLGLYRLARAWIQSEDLDADLRLDEAKKRLDELKKMDPRFVPALNGLGYLLYGLGNVDGALDHFDEVQQLAPKDTPDFKYAEECIRLITEHRGRRRWVETFDRPNSQRVGNRWVQSPRAGVEVAPRIEDGKVVIAGRWDRSIPNIWLYSGDPTARGNAVNRLNQSFLRTRAVFTSREGDGIATQFMIFVLQARGQDIVTGLGFERNARGEVTIIKRKVGGSKKQWLQEPVTDDEGNKMMWPAGPVELEIERIDPKKGVFQLFVNGASVAVVELGLKQGQGSLSVGFKLTGTSGKSFRTEIEEVEIELYQQ